MGARKGGRRWQDKYGGTNHNIPKRVGTGVPPCDGEGERGEGVRVARVGDDELVLVYSARHSVVVDGPWRRLQRLCDAHRVLGADT